MVDVIAPREKYDFDSKLQSVQGLFTELQELVQHANMAMNKVMYDSWNDDFATIMLETRSLALNLEELRTEQSSKL